MDLGVVRENLTRCAELPRRLRLRVGRVGPQVGAAVGRSLGLDPNNPRAKYIRLTNEIGTARFFGSDTAPFCESASELLDQWDFYELKSAIHPAWGKDLVQEIVNGCGK